MRVPIRTVATSSIAVLLLAVAGTVVSQPQPQDQQAPATASKPMPRDAAWLKPFVGEWTIEYKMYVDPEAEPMTAAGSDTVHAVGDFWVVANSKADLMGMPYHAMLTLGYNAGKKHFVGTYIDSMSEYMWQYTGTLSEDGTTLTLETEGPSAFDPAATTIWREVHSIKSKDHRTFSSSVKDPEGNWVRMLTADYRRKK